MTIVYFMDIKQSSSAYCSNCKAIPGKSCMMVKVSISITVLNSHFSERSLW